MYLSEVPKMLLALEFYPSLASTASFSSESIYVTN